MIENKKKPLLRNMQVTLIISPYCLLFIPIIVGFVVPLVLALPWPSLVIPSSLFSFLFLVSPLLPSIATIVK
ncbi:hypothetical protein L208DRAFT_890643 [Tricholoma matsutake]|nr:hypothetical protein L208DRAFT_890643 [Tricholoma matsutake 945]